MDVLNPNKSSEALNANTLITVTDNEFNKINANTNQNTILSRSSSMISNGSLFCRICHQNESCDTESDLISPCNCSGSMAYVHQHCLQRWASISSTSTCDICGFNYNCRRTFPSILMWLKSIITGKGLTVEIIIILLMAISTALIIFATVMSSLIGKSDRILVKHLLNILWSVTVFSWTLYFVMFYCTVRFLYRSFSDWKESHIIVELVWSQTSSSMQSFENYI